MTASPIQDESRLCVHSITTKPWTIEEAAKYYAREGVAGITVWQNALEGRDPKIVGRMLREEGLTVVSLCRGGFFPASDAKGRQKAIDDNRRIVEQAAALGAPLVVLVCGAVPKQPLSVSRQQIQDGIEAIRPEAEAAGVKLGIEPLHPMYADFRSAVNTLGQANTMAEQIGSPSVGVVVDVYHLWWDPDLESEIERCGWNRHLFAFHICDWRVPTEDLLTDRELMGQGCINVPEIRGWVESTGFNGFNEVEIFSTRYWGEDQLEFLRKIKRAYRSAS